jgi:CBS-domain-containing membrane protein
MRQHGVRRLPVVGGDGGLRGIVSADNLWQLLAEEIDALARVIAAAQARENRTRGALAASSGTG